MSKFFLFLIALFLGLSSAYSQSDKVLLTELTILGNKKTKDWVIQRELNVEVGDSIDIQQLDRLFKNNRLQVLSTGLFNNVTFNLRNYKASSSTATIEIIVEENWYLFPVPIFELADRNFTVWWEEQGRSFSRVNYGFRIGHYNFTGNRDPLKLKIHYGYTRKYELEYAYPYLAWDNKLGIAGSIFYAENREIAYKTEGNKSLFRKLDDERKLLSRFRVGPQLKYRPSLNSYHSLRIEYHHNQIDEYVATELNPDYFLDGKTDLRFAYLEYDYNYDKRLYSNYPQGGYLIFGNLKKEGLGIFNDYNNLSLTLGFEKHHSISNIILSTRNKGKVNLDRSIVAFANNTGIGWGRDIVSGYELYVMDGTDYVISMNDVKWRLYDNNLNTVKWMPKQFRKMNMTLFFRVNLDAAYVNERTYIATNGLSNKWIYGGGPAVDIILFNNFLFSFEYSFNDIGEQGLFFHNSFAF